MTIYSGRKLKLMASSGEMVTRSQSARMAIQAISSKYGIVEENVKYYHRGTGIWQKYILQNDRKRTGKLSTTLKQWKNAPYRYDTPGIDTKYRKLKVFTQQDDISEKSERVLINDALKMAVSLTTSDTKSKMTMGSFWHKGKPQQSIIKDRLKQIIKMLIGARRLSHNTTQREASYQRAIADVKVVLSKPAVRTTDCYDVIKIVQGLVRNMPTEIVVKKKPEITRYKITNPRGDGEIPDCLKAPDKPKRVRKVTEKVKAVKPKVVKPKVVKPKVPKYIINTIEAKQLRKALSAVRTTPKPGIPIRRADTHEVIEVKTYKKMMKKQLRLAAGCLVVARGQVPCIQKERRAKYNKVIETLKKKASDPKISVATCKPCIAQVQRLTKV